MEDLARLFGEMAEKIPTSKYEEVVYSAATLPISPTQMVTDQLYVERGFHDYHPGWFRADKLSFHARKATYQQLGLLIMAVMFHEMPAEVHLELTHPASEIKHLILQSPSTGPDALRPGYNTRPYCFVYSPHPTTRWFSWPQPHLDPLDLPCFYLTNQEDSVITEQDRVQRDTVRGFGTDKGSILFAELLLNAGQTNNPLNEYDLEGDGGYRGVGYLSAEVKLWLPESPGWDSAQWPPDA